MLAKHISINGLNINLFSNSGDISSRIRTELEFKTLSDIYLRER